MLGVLRMLYNPREVLIQWREIGQINVSNVEKGRKVQILHGEGMVDLLRLRPWRLASVVHSTRADLFVAV